MEVSPDTFHVGRLGKNPYLGHFHFVEYVYQQIRADVAVERNDTVVSTACNIPGPVGDRFQTINSWE
jgi:hypothetical protein